MIDKNLIIAGGKYLFILYLIIAGNYLGTLLKPDIHDFFVNNPMIKYIFGFFILYFFISLADTEDKHSKKEKLILSIVIYIIFLMSGKMDKKYWLIFIVLLGVVYLLSIVKFNNNMEIIEYLLLIVGFLILILGFIKNN